MRGIGWHQASRPPCATNVPYSHIPLCNMTCIGACSAFNYLGRFRSRHSKSRLQAPYGAAVGSLYLRAGCSSKVNACAPHLVDWVPANVGMHSLGKPGHSICDPPVPVPLEIILVVVTVVPRLKAAAGAYVIGWLPVQVQWTVEGIPTDRAEHKRHLTPVLHHQIAAGDVSLSVGCTCASSAPGARLAYSADTASTTCRISASVL